METTDRWETEYPCEWCGGRGYHMGSDNMDIDMCAECHGTGREKGLVYPPKTITMPTHTGELEIGNMMEAIAKYPLPWAVVRSRYADGFNGYDIVCVNDEQTDVLEKVPYNLAITIVRLVNDSPIAKQIDRINCG